MSENILLKMTEEKNRLINLVITAFLGHNPTDSERKSFTFMHGLGESFIYYKGSLIDTVRYETKDDLAII
jgi:hypothetical protein